MCQMDAHIIPPSGNQSSTTLANEPRKKKRVHRAAKLKQCKLDARREQWLAQVSTKANQLGYKENKDVSPSKSLQDDAVDVGVSGVHEKKGTGLSHSLQDEIYMPESGIRKVSKETDLSSQDVVHNMGAVKDSGMKNEVAHSWLSQVSIHADEIEMHDSALSEPLQSIIHIDLPHASQGSIHINDHEKNNDASIPTSLQDSIHVDDTEMKNASLSEFSQDSIHMPENDAEDKKEGTLSQYPDNAIFIALKRDVNENKEFSLSRSSQDIIRMASNSYDREVSLEAMRDRSVSSSNDATDGNANVHDVNSEMHPTAMRAQNLLTDHHLGLHSHSLNGVDYSLHLRQSAYCSTESGVCMSDQRIQSNIAGFGGRVSVPSCSSSESTCRSISSHGSSCSGSDVEVEDADDEVEDWETVADALNIQESLHEANNQNGNPPESLQVDNSRNGRGSELWRNDLEKCVLKPQSKFRTENSGYKTRADASRAWRPDDVSRPLTLPCLKKQNSFPMQSFGSRHDRNVWGLPLAPSHCPICTEELDTTDSSFLPCPCSFRLCLFCHHKILISDARCPGCRKPYNLEETSKLSRTASLRPRLLN